MSPKRKTPFVNPAIVIWEDATLDVNAEMEAGTLFAATVGMIESIDENKVVIVGEAFSDESFRLRTVIPRKMVKRIKMLGKVTLPEFM